MRPLARERIPNAAAAYLEAYVALELSAHRAQALVDRLVTIARALTDTGTRLRSDAWKIAGISELPSAPGATVPLSLSIRLAKMPTGAQLLEGIADWRKKRSYLQQLWDTLPAEARSLLKVPETLD